MDRHRKKQLKSERWMKEREQDIKDKKERGRIKW